MKQMKPVLVFSHTTCDPPGYIGELLDRYGYPYQIYCLAEQHQVPSQLDDWAGFIFMGGPGNVNTPEAWMAEEIALINRAHASDLPMLGICLGAQLLSKAFGGSVWEAEELEVGWHSIKMLPQPFQHPWLEDMDSEFLAFHWHAHEFSPPPRAISIASSDCTSCQGFIHGRHLALQFHLEMTPEIIDELLVRFASDIETPNLCVQQVRQIKDNIENKCENAYAVADVLLGRWLKTLSS
ncbi:MAG: type 1 glutamine amidotransferase [Gammaproteobacteria bacterium]|nr:type 1 glutamine amidotransferase [Gammaproteobacteria bacterium]